MDEKEIGHLLSVLGRGARRDQLDAALRYVRATQPHRFLLDSNARLRPDQKPCIVLNMSDGKAEQGERRLDFRTLVAKNDRVALDR